VETGVSEIDNLVTGYVFTSQAYVEVIRYRYNLNCRYSNLIQPNTYNYVLQASKIPGSVATISFV
jgi:hypothetical protein